MPPNCDIYVATATRTSEMVNSFLDKFAHKCRELAQLYELPYQSEEIRLTFNSAAETVEYLIAHPSEHYVIYWVPSEENLADYAIVGFTTDGGMILGLSCDEEDERLHDELGTSLKSFVDAEDYLCLFETPPPSTMKEFRELLEQVMQENES